MKKIKSVFLAVVLAVSAIALGSGPAQAGGSCLPPTYYRSGDYVTYGSYATGSATQGHRVQVVWNGVWYSGPIVYGNGTSWKTLRHPGRNGIAICSTGW